MIGDSVMMSDAPAPALHCANHPDRETVLRCNRCEKPICTQCAIRTPVGYRCKECVQQQRAVYFNDRPADPFIAGAVAVALGFVVGIPLHLFLGIFGLFSFIIAVFVGPALGGLAAEAVRRAVGKRRGRYLKYITVGAWIVGVLAAWGVLVAAGLLAPAAVFRLHVLLAVALAVSAITARLW